MRRAVTVVEILVALGIGGVVFVALMSGFRTGSLVAGRGMETVDALSTTALALEHLRRDLRGLAGPLPAPVSRSPGEWSLDLLRLDGVDVASGRGKYAPVRWELSHAGGRTLLARDADGERVTFPYDGEVAITVAARAGGIGVEFATRPPVRALLTRQDPGAPVRLVEGVPRIPRARLLPDLEHPAAVYPPDVYPRGR